MDLPANETDDPLPVTRRRLGHAHVLWHRMAEDYGDPEAFCVSLNAALEAYRTVTFMLKKERRVVPELDFVAHQAGEPICRHGGSPIDDRRGTGLSPPGAA